MTQQPLAAPEAAPEGPDTPADLLALALEASGMGTWDWNARTGAIRCSPAFEALFGFPPGTFPRTLDAYSASVHPEDREQALTTLADAVTQRRRFTHHYRVVWADGQQRWLQGTGIPIFDGDDLRGMAGVCLDATDRQVAELRLLRQNQVSTALLTVGQAVTSQLELDQVVQTVTDAATALSGAQLGAFFYFSEDEQGESLLLYNLSGAAREDFAAFGMPRLTEIFRPTLEGEAVLRSPDITGDLRYGHNVPHRGVPQGHPPIRSYLAVPVRLSHGEVAGGLFFGHAQAGVFDEDAERLVTGIAAYAATAIENSRLFERATREARGREEVARALQRPLRPPALPDIPGVALSVAFEPLGGRDVGGDFFDLFPVQAGRWVLILGDVSGKGPEAAALTGLVRYTAWAAARSDEDPASILAVVNAALMREDHERFCTAVVALLSPSDGGLVLELGNAGHLPVLIRRHGEPARLLGSGGFPLGMFEELEVGATRLSLSAGDQLVLCTDGLLDRAGLQVVGEQQLLDTVSRAPEDPRLVVRDLKEMATAMGAPRDDLAVLVLQSR